MALAMVTGTILILDHNYFSEFAEVAMLVVVAILAISA